MIFRSRPIIAVAVLLGLGLITAACTGQGPGASTADTPALPAATQQPAPPATIDAATRTAPVVAGRPGRVFIFAGVGDTCELLPDPQLSIVQPPQKGEITFKPGQTTTIAASKSGKCIGTKATGTGVYYTAREGTSGTDAFALTARMPTGETMTRSFAVTIAP